MVRNSYLTPANHTSPVYIFGALYYLSMDTQCAINPPPL